MHYAEVQLTQFRAENTADFTGIALNPADNLHFRIDFQNLVLMDRDFGRFFLFDIADQVDKFETHVRLTPVFK